MALAAWASLVLTKMTTDTCGAIRRPFNEILNFKRNLSDFELRNGAML